MPGRSTLLGTAAKLAQQEFQRLQGCQLLEIFNESMKILVLVASVRLVSEPCQMITHQNGTKKVLAGFFMRRASCMRTATPTQIVKVRTYKSLLGRCKAKMKT